MSRPSDGLAFRCAGCAGVNKVDAARLRDGPVCGRCQAPLDTSGAPLDLGDRELEALVRSSPVPVLVDLWAPWCGPCRLVAPEIDRVARANAGRLIVVKVDTDQHQQTLVSLGARGIPTFAIYQGGELRAQRSGALSRPQLEAWLRATTG